MSMLSKIWPFSYYMRRKFLIEELTKIHTKRGWTGILTDTLPSLTNKFLEKTYQDLK